MEIKRRTPRVLILSLLAAIVCSLAEARTGTADKLNELYGNVVQSCANGTRPAHYCSGVFVRTLDKRHRGTFWTHDVLSQKLGAEPFVFVRRDLQIVEIGQEHGAIFLNPGTAEAADKPMDVLCAYPFATPTGPAWADHGCRAPSLAARSTTSSRQGEDKASCEALGIRDAIAWLDHFHRNGMDVSRQCSLSADVPATFAASMEAHLAFDENWDAKPNRLMVANWNGDLPFRVPVQAVFYVAGGAGGLRSALIDQRDYYQETGRWIPVLRLDLSDAQGRVFSESPDEQLSVGFEVADAMNARYRDTAPQCPDGSASYQCNGVLIRGTRATTAFHAWDPSPGSIADNGVSFSYLRADVGTKVMFGYQGFAFGPLSTSNPSPLVLRCAFPYDAGTSEPGDACPQGQLCSNIGVMKYSTWVERYVGTGIKSCPFAPDAAQFQLSIEVRGYTTNPDIRRTFNEVMIGAWEPGFPDRLPMEAFIYRTDVSDVQGARLGAQYIQADYYKETGRFLPIVRMQFGATDGHLFAYDPSDQLSPGKPDDALVKRRR